MGLSALDIVYASLDRRSSPDTDPAGEVAEAIDALWAHATPADGLEHASGRAQSHRLDLLLYLLTPDPAAATPCASQRAAALLAHCHQASPLLRRRYLPPAPPVPAPPAPAPPAPAPTPEPADQSPETAGEHPGAVGAPAPAAPAHTAGTVCTARP